MVEGMGMDNITLFELYVQRDIPIFQNILNNDSSQMNYT
jgi:hypothetical protein